MHVVPVGASQQSDVCAHLLPSIEHPVVGFRNVIKVCLELGYSDEDISKMISGNPLRLLGLEN